MRTCLLFLLLCPVALCAQTATDIWLFDLGVKKGALEVSNGRNITLRKGYDNQPFFHPHQPILYFSSAQDDGRTDIKQYDLKSKQFSLLTQTADREYSPTVSPDGRFVSCIIQRDNGAQDLGRYPIEGGPSEVLIDHLLVGYHAWVDDRQVAVFTLGDVMTLHVVDIVSKSDTVLASNIGRSMHRIPGRQAISFVQKGEGEWQIKRINAKSLTIEDIALTLKGREDLAWLPQGNILMSDGSKLFEWDKRTGWNEVLLDSKEPLSGITRLAVDGSGKYLAIVINEK